jgi:hypothetical protein
MEVMVEKNSNLELIGDLSWSLQSNIAESESGIDIAEPDFGDFKLFDENDCEEEIKEPYIPVQERLK